MTRKNPTNGVSSPSIGMSRLLLGGRPTRTLGATDWGVTHMVHAYELIEWTNPHGATFTNWRASCGAKWHRVRSLLARYVRAGQSRLRPSRDALPGLLRWRVASRLAGS
jgi:hypothetical protein